MKIINNNCNPDDKIPTWEDYGYDRFLNKEVAEEEARRAYTEREEERRKEQKHSESIRINRLNGKS